MSLSLPLCLSVCLFSPIYLLISLQISFSFGHLLLSPFPYFSIFPLFVSFLLSLHLRLATYYLTLSHSISLSILPILFLSTNIPMRSRRLVREDFRGGPEPEVHLRVAGSQRVQAEGLWNHHGPGQGNRKFNKIIEMCKILTFVLIVTFPSNINKSLNWSIMSRRF